MTAGYLAWGFLLWGFLLGMKWKMAGKSVRNFCGPDELTIPFAGAMACTLTFLVALWPVSIIIALIAISRERS